MFSIKPKLIAASAVIAAVVSMGPLAIAQMPIISDGAQTYPSGPSTKSLSADQRTKLIADLQAAKQHDRQRARDGPRSRSSKAITARRSGISIES
jgi:hypothetical protein